MTEETANTPTAGAETEQQNVANNGQTTNDEQKPKTLNDILPGEGTNLDRKSTRLNSSHGAKSRMPSSA